MSLETLNKDELIKIIKDKQLVFEVKNSKKTASDTFVFSAEELRGVVNSRCRLCIGERYEVPDPANPVGKVLKHRGQPISQSMGGTQPACRTCRHVRAQVAKQGYVDVYI